LIRPPVIQLLVPHWNELEEIDNNYHFSLFAEIDRNRF